MTVVLRAMSIPDAAGFIEIDGRLRLLQPPYTKASSPELSVADLEDAIKRFAYQKDDRSFASAAEAIEFLRAEHRKWASKVGLPTEGVISVDEFLSDANPELANGIMDRIEQELLRIGTSKNGAILLAGIIRIFEKNVHLQLRAGKLFAKLTKMKHGQQPQSAKIIDKRFDTLQENGVQERISEISDKIRERHCILELCE